jgi:hypothetical protein
MRSKRKAKKKERSNKTNNLSSKTITNSINSLKKGKFLFLTKMEVSDKPMRESTNGGLMSPQIRQTLSLRSRFQSSWTPSL